MVAGVGYSEIPNTSDAGMQAAGKALDMAGRSDPCDVALVFCTARHDQAELREAVSAVIGASVPIYGGGAVGVITNGEYGYAGCQAGVACLWLDGVECEAVSVGGLKDGEVAAGRKLGEGLAKAGVTPESPVTLFYDAIGQNDSQGVTLTMATWILEGIEKALGFLPRLIGAGLQGDHACSPTRQYLGDAMGEHSAMALAFGGEIHVDSVVLHGCRPATGYYTVTKADGPVILEINGVPAIDFVDALLESAIPPERYPFFLLFGVNSGERWGEYREEKYASRLCLGIDPVRRGIVMFEPDMTEGVEFQIMFRSTDLNYMKPRFESAFERLAGRKPVFALYIDCAGRCAGYEGIDAEDAVLLQEVVGDRVPLLGLYTGVEIAPVGGKPRGLDWTGVFCLFSQRRGEAEPDGAAQDRAVQDEAAPDRAVRYEAAPDRAVRYEAAQDRAVQDEAAQGSAESDQVASGEAESDGRERGAAGLAGRGRPGRRPPDAARPEETSQLAMNRLCERNAARILALESQMVGVRFALELKRRGFRLLSELAVSLRGMDDYKSVSVWVAERINAALNMQRTVALLRGEDGLFRPAALQGFPANEAKRLKGRADSITADGVAMLPMIAAPGEPLPESLSRLSEAYGIARFVAAPVMLQGDPAAVLITGRVVEQPPYLTRLGNDDMETIIAISDLLGSMLARLRLREVTIKAETDGLTGLWNRGTFQSRVGRYLSGADGSGGLDAERPGAFIMIDIDYFKEVNDSYGHLAGDKLLADCANALRGVMRDSDIVARHGGDEFAVFAPGIKDCRIAMKKAAQIRKEWGRIYPEGGSNRATASIGIAIAPIHGATYKELYANADAALYKAKKRGRDRAMLWEPAV